MYAFDAMQIVRYFLLMMLLLQCMRFFSLDSVVFVCVTASAVAAAAVIFVVVHARCASFSVSVFASSFP